MKTRMVFVSITAFLLACGSAMGQPGQTPPPRPPKIGVPINGDQAQLALSAAEAKAREQGWALSLAVVDTHGHLVMFKAMPEVGLHTADVAIRKAKTAALMRTTSKAVSEMASRNPMLSQLLPELVPVEGGVPIILNGELIGAIGASGATSVDDGLAAVQGASAVR